MVKEHPVSVLLLLLIVVVAVVGQASKEKSGQNNSMKSEVEVSSDFRINLAVVTVVLAAIVYVIWIRGQPWKRR